MVAAASAMRCVRTRAASVAGRSSGVSPGRTTMSPSVKSSSGKPVRAVATASPVPRCTCCSTKSTGRPAGASSCRVLVTRSAPCPTTTTTRSMSSSARASITCRTSGRPHKRCRGLGRADFIRVPSPAASTTADIGRELIPPVYRAATPQRNAFTIAGAEGIEPPFAAPKTAVLPLDDAPLTSSAYRPPSDPPSNWRQLRTDSVHRCRQLRALPVLAAATHRFGACLPPERWWEVDGETAGFRPSALRRYPVRPHGVVDQEAPQADAQEEAQEDAEGHPLAAAGGQVAPRPA